MANIVYNRGIFKVMNIGTLATLDLRVLLVQSTYAESKAHNFVSDVVAHELSVAGYARVALANKVLVEDDANNFVYLDADDVVSGVLTAGQTIGGAILYIHTGNDATAELISYYDLINTPTNGGTFTVQWNTPANGGVLKGVA